MDRVVVMRAEQHEIVETCPATIRPVDEVVSLGPGSGQSAAREDAAAVPSDERTPERRSNEAFGAAEIQHLPSRTQNDGDQIGVASEVP